MRRLAKIVNHNTNKHGVNENLRLKNLWDGIEVFARILADAERNWRQPISNRAIEIHDSTLASLTIQSGHVVLSFFAAYVHQAEGRPSVFAPAESALLYSECPSTPWAAPVLIFPSTSAVPNWDPPPKIVQGILREEREAARNIPQHSPKTLNCEVSQLSSLGDEIFL